MEAVFDKIVSGTLRGQIAQKIRQAILTGSLKEGQRLIERDLAAQFAISLTVIREALIDLEKDGFVIKRPSAATYVTKLALETVEKSFFFRKINEGFAVEEAARRITPDQALALERTYRNLHGAARKKDAQLYVQTDFALHEIIWKIASNEYVEEALRRALLPIFAFTVIRVISRRSFNLTQDAESHWPLVEAIRSKNPRQARRAFLEALDGWLSRIRESVFAEAEEKPVISFAKATRK
jgi:DNA-binding GntR family transcriptional regulator